MLIISYMTVSRGRINSNYEDRPSKSDNNTSNTNKSVHQEIIDLLFQKKYE